MLILDSLKANELERDDRWWALYEASFPSDEREPADVILSAVEQQVGLALRARQGNTTVGIATTHLLSNPNAVFLIYLAVDRAHQSGGIGGRLLEYAWTASAARLSDPAGMVWEVDPQGSPDADQCLVCERRIAFFRRHGGVLLTRPYFQPPVNGPAPVPMQLMFRPASGAVLPNDGEVEALVRAMYLQKYGRLNGISNQVLAQLLS